MNIVAIWLSCFSLDEISFCVYLIKIFPILALPIIQTTIFPDVNASFFEAVPSESLLADRVEQQEFKRHIIIPRQFEITQGATTTAVTTLSNDSSDLSTITTDVVNNVSTENDATTILQTDNITNTSTEMESPTTMWIELEKTFFIIMLFSTNDVNPTTIVQELNNNNSSSVNKTDQNNTKISNIIAKFV